MGIIQKHYIRIRQWEIYNYLRKHYSVNQKKILNFNFKNTGQKPLIIKEVIPSCGCISVKWPKHPILPKESSKIQITFETNSLGKFNKSIEVICNTTQEIHTLKLSGYINNK